ncbi:MAG TPA: hypothetical protein VFA57_03030 [Pseudolabrys sp.]|nr:hypothetical protein [Pseudolabrys sp.]
MKWKSVVAAAAVAVSACAGGARAAEHKPVHRVIRATDFWVGSAWTGAGLAMSSPIAAVAVGTTIGCAVTEPMVASAVLKRPLSYREAHILIGSCLIPFIGGWLVNEAYNKGWLWAPDEKPRRMARRHGKPKMVEEPAAQAAKTAVR